MIVTLSMERFVVRAKVKRLGQLWLEDSSFASNPEEGLQNSQLCSFPAQLVEPPAGIKPRSSLYNFLGRQLVLNFIAPTSAYGDYNWIKTRPVSLTEIADLLFKGIF